MRLHLNDSSMERQCILHQFELPSVLIALIKDYAFPTHEYLKVKKIKNTILRLLRITSYKEYNTPTGFWFWSFREEDPQIQSEFCITCGNYYLATNRKIICTCS